jgi:hypothetical protein
MAGTTRASSRFGFRCFNSVFPEEARGVTAMVVGSGALLGFARGSKRDCDNNAFIASSARDSSLVGHIASAP